MGFAEERIKAVREQQETAKKESIEREAANQRRIAELTVAVRQLTQEVETLRQQQQANLSQAGLADAVRQATADGLADLQGQATALSQQLDASVTAYEKRISRAAAKAESASGTDVNVAVIIVVLTILAMLGTSCAACWWFTQDIQQELRTIENTTDRTLWNQAYPNKQVTPFTPKFYENYYNNEKDYVINEQIKAAQEGAAQNGQK